MSQAEIAEMGVLSRGYRAELWNRELWASRSCALRVPKGATCRS